MSSHENNPFYGREHIDPFAKQLDGFKISRRSTKFLGAEVTFGALGTQTATKMVDNALSLHLEAATWDLGRTAVMGALVLGVYAVDKFTGSFNGHEKIVRYMEDNANAEDVIAGRLQEEGQYLKPQASENAAY